MVWQAVTLDPRIQMFPHCADAGDSGVFGKNRQKTADYNEFAAFFPGFGRIILIELTLQTKAAEVYERCVQQMVLICFCIALKWAPAHRQAFVR